MTILRQTFSNNGRSRTPWIPGALFLSLGTIIHFSLIFEAESCNQQIDVFWNSNLHAELNDAAVDSWDSWGAWSEWAEESGNCTCRWNSVDGSVDGSYSGSLVRRRFSEPSGQEEVQHKSEHKECNDECPFCGKHDFKHDRRRIIGGTDVRYGTLPYQVMLLDENGQFCGGTLVGPRYVLTAAHCIFDESISRVSAILGADTSDGQGVDAIEVKIVNWIYHEDFVSNEVDIAIILLEESVINSVYSNDKIWPACLPKKMMNLKTGNMSLASGWGSTQPTDIDGNPFNLPNVAVLSSPHPLQQVWIPLLSIADCRAMMERSGQLGDGSAQVYEKEICAGLEEGGKDGCQGDSGGPLVIFDTAGNATVIGVTSWGYGCGAPGLPGVYARVDEYLSWIDEAMKRLH